MDKILVVDDEESIRAMLTRILTKEGLEVQTASDGEEALATFDKVRPDLVLLDVMMPKLNGFQVCERLKSCPETRLIPVIMITSSSATENRVRGIEAGVDDFLAKPFERIELTARVRSLLRLKHYTDQLEQAETVLCALAQSIEGKDPYTNGHCARLSRNSERLGRRLHLSEDDLVALRRGGLVHDIGKVAVPDAILLKKGRLDDEEMAIMRRHTIVGEEICRTLKSFRLVLPIIRHHHEKGDGTGYPDGLSGDAIPQTARILQVVDVYDALTTERPYKAAFPMEQALAVMQEEVDRNWWSASIFKEFRGLLLDEGFWTIPAGQDQAVLQPIEAAGGVRR